MKNRFIVAGVLMFLVCAFCGCSSSVNVGMSLLPDGTIRQSFSVVLDEREIAQKYDEDEAQAIYDVVYDYLNAYQIEINDLAMTYITEHEMLGRYPWKAWIEPQENTGTTRGGRIVCYILFASSYFYNEYVALRSGEPSGGEEEEDASETTIEEGLFCDKIIYQDTTLPIADAEEIQKVYDEIKAELSARGVSLGEDVKFANICYDYAVPQDYARVNRLKANCDTEYLQTEMRKMLDGTSESYVMKHYVWNYEPDGDNRLVLYRYRVNAVAWYVAALVLVAVFAVVMLVGHKVMKVIKGKSGTTPSAGGGVVGGNDSDASAAGFGTSAGLGGASFGGSGNAGSVERNLNGGGSASFDGNSGNANLASGNAGSFKVGGVNENAGDKARQAGAGSLSQSSAQNSGTGAQNDGKTTQTHAQLLNDYFGKLKEGKTPSKSDNIGDNDKN